MLGGCGPDFLSEAASELQHCQGQGPCWLAVAQSSFLRQLQSCSTVWVTPGANMPTLARLVCIPGAGAFQELDSACRSCSKCRAYSQSGSHFDLSSGMYSRSSGGMRPLSNLIL